MIGFFYGLTDNGEDVVLIDDLVFVAVNFDFGAAVTAGQNDITDFDIEGDGIAVVIFFAGTESDNGVFLGFFFCAVGDEDSTFHLFGVFTDLQEDTIAKRLDVCRHFTISFVGLYECLTELILYYKMNG